MATLETSNGSALEGPPSLFPVFQNPAAPRRPPVKKSYIEELLERHGSHDRVIRALREESRSNPVESLLNLQVFLNAIGEEEKSFNISNELLKIAPLDQRVLFNRGWHLLKRGQLQKGLALLENGRPLRTYGHLPLKSRQPLWTRQIGRGHRVLLALEGGFGDEIIHARFAQDFAEKYDCKVTVICHPALASLFAGQPWVSAVAQREAALGIYHDSWVPGMAAALALGHEYENLTGDPYLRADQNRMKQWTGLLGEKRKIRVGLRWAGNPEFEHQQLRLFPPEILLRLSKHPQVQLYSFQRDNNLLNLPHGITDLAPRLKTWDDTAAALMHMDLTVTSCTSVAHLSGALGRPTWVLVPALPYFTWATPGTSSPWYKSVTLFRQKSFGSWKETERSLHQAFEKFIYNHHESQEGP